ncbi:hypothetical protein BCR33DRAFT_846982 [Rhizoclosmatium globosum]|uniref:DDE-1 domain-containing protein n=1 Tax=Rhizoclosmatium globosum TaxID=329046 RepID=A0A1Y2CU87_9FUNG|nr:hypothetical protein BCR33DRAFT_846982 [Rhizoclosmatium globosum]|eukprot:ORY50527.1 hypothetical protein BCR33DRAFT_846982 [Rhizoclosmatium globosum]
MQAAFDIQRRREEDNVALLRLLGGIPYNPNYDHDYVPTSRKVIMRWMYNEQVKGSATIPARAIKQFPNAFRQSYGANHKKACRWFNDCEGTFDRGSLHVSSYTDGGRVQVQRKARRGCGRKVSPWVSAIHLELKDEFERLRKAGVKFDPNLLRTLAVSLVSRGLEYGPDYEMLLGKDSVDIDGKKHIDKLTYRWNFMERNNIVTRRQTGKLSVSPEKQEAIERSVAYHMGQLKRDFENGTLDEDLVRNADEAHFIVNMDNHKTLGFIGDEEVKYSDVTSGGEGMTMVVWMGGGKEALLGDPMMIFQNAQSSFPIRGVPNDVEGVSYRTGPKGWIDRSVFPLFISDPKSFVRHRNGKLADPQGRKVTLFVDNCGGHNDSPLLRRALDNANPADQWPIQKVKECWTKIWNKEKLRMLENEDVSEASGKLKNPGKHFFLRTASQSVKDANSQKDSDGLSYTRKAMIRCGLSLENGEWKESMLSKQLQDIINKYRDNFDGTPVDEVVESEQECSSGSE